MLLINLTALPLMVVIILPVYPLMLVINLTDLPFNVGQQPGRLTL